MSKVVQLIPEFRPVKEILWELEQVVEDNDYEEDGHPLAYEVEIRDLEALTSYIRALEDKVRGQG